jgi:hypothetical protein
MSETVLQQLHALKPQIAVVFPDAIFVSQLAIWEPYLLACGYRVCVCAKTRGNKQVNTTLPVFYQDEGFAIPYLRQIKSLQVFLYTTNRANDFHYLNKFGGIKHVFIGHGDSEKASSSSRFSKVYDYLLVADKNAYTRYAKAGVDIPKSSFFMMGAPTLPGLRFEPDKQSIRKILYAPTFEGKTDPGNYSSLAKIGRLLEAEAVGQQIELRFRAHPGTGQRLKDYVGYRQDLAAAALPEQEEQSSTKVSQFNWADAIIADVSGVLSEFLFTGKPIIVPASVTDRLTHKTVQATELRHYVYLWNYQTLSLEEFLASIDGDPLRQKRLRVRKEKFKDATNFKASSTVFNQALRFFARKPSAKRLIMKAILNHFFKKKSPKPAISPQATKPKPPPVLKALDDGTAASEMMCPICGGAMTKRSINYINAANVDAFVGVHEFHRCQTCDFIANPLNRTKEFNPADDQGRRAGSATKPGREFALVSKAVTDLFPPDRSPSVLIFGAGKSLDWMHIQKVERVKSCHITDLANYQEADVWIPLSSNDTFDIVVASEVLEHFESPADNLASLLTFCSDSGVVICGTNLNTPNDNLARLKYPYYNGHCAYWSSTALSLVAERHGFQMGIGQSSIGGPRKRYIFFFKDPSFHARLAISAGKSQTFI